MNSLSSRFDTMKSYVPSLLNSSKEKVSEIFTLMTQSESDFLTKAENTDTEIKELLKSKMEMEVILGLKFLLVHVLKGKDISKFHPDIVYLFSSTSQLIKSLCLNLIDHIALEKKDVLILLYNSVSKKVSDNDPLQRWSILHLINSMKTQSINLDCSKHIIPLLSDSNPIIRRLALVSLVHYLKNFSSINQNIAITDEELTNILKMYFNDPHPLIFSTAFYAICELKNRDYISLNIPNRFTYFCDNLKNVDNFYFERVIFSLVNFAKLFLLNNFEKNKKYVEILFKSLFKIVKYSTNFSKILTALHGLYEIIKSIDDLKLNSISKEELQLFKSGRQLSKLGDCLIRLVISSCNKSDHEKFSGLELILKFLQNNIINNISKNSGTTNNLSNSYLSIVRESLEKNYNIFYLKINDKEFINIKKLEILINLANENNIKIILEEFKRNLNYPNLNLKKMIVKSIYHICKINSQREAQSQKNNSNISDPSFSKISISSLCIERLIDLLKLKEEGVISQIIICLRKLILEIKEQTKFVLIYNIKNYKKNVTSSIAKANIIWMISQYIQTIPTVSVDFYRRLLLEIDNESDEVKSQLLGFAMRINSELNFISQQYKEDVRDQTVSRIKTLISYTIEKLLWDKNYNIREKARMVDYIIKNNLFDRQLDFISDYLSMNTRENENLSEKNLISENSCFPLSICSKISHSLAAENNKLISDSSTTYNFENYKFFYDSLDSETHSNLHKICLDDIINFKKAEELEKSGGQKNTTNSNNNQLLNNQKYSSVVQQDNVNSSVQNFSGGIDVEETRKKLQNQLDDFLNNEDDEDEYEVEIKRD
jgi:vesicle coat complex subunit